MLSDWVVGRSHQRVSRPRRVSFGIEVLEGRALPSAVSLTINADYAVGVRPNSVIAADFNGDHRADLAVTSTTGLDVLLGNGDGTFSNGYHYAGITVGGSVAYPEGAAAGDLNGDGRL